LPACVPGVSGDPADLRAEVDRMLDDLEKLGDLDEQRRKRRRKAQ
jgi:hypothetical protein